MKKLVKIHNGTLVVTDGVATPTYSLRASDYETGGTPPDGWEAIDDVVEADFAVPWVQPAGVFDAYSAGDIVLHGGSKWRSMVNGNVWEPGVTAWMEVTAGTPAWAQPLGAHDAYPKDFVVAHAGKLWRSLVAANVWEPPTNWRETALTPPGLETQYPDWVQPTGAGDAYALGDRVRHADKNWISTVSANVWEPGVYGWDEL